MKVQTIIFLILFFLLLVEVSSNTHSSSKTKTSKLTTSNSMTISKTAVTGNLDFYLEISSQEIKGLLDNKYNLEKVKFLVIKNFFIHRSYDILKLLLVKINNYNIKFISLECISKFNSNSFNDFVLSMNETYFDNLTLLNIELSTSYSSDEIKQIQGNTWRTHKILYNKLLITNNKSQVYPRHPSGDLLMIKFNNLVQFVNKQIEINKNFNEYIVMVK